MRFPRLAHRLFVLALQRVAMRREPDFIVGADNPQGAYLRRWFLTPWRPLQSRLRKRAEATPTWWNRTSARVVGWLPNLYLHEFLRDDDDRALHDHPSWAASFILAGAYTEHTIAPGGVHHRKRHDAGTLRFLGTRHAHRIELLPAWWEVDNYDAAVDAFHSHPREKAPCWTVFLFGPTVRDWGFHCPERGWVHWREFTAANKPGEIGPGCDA